MTERHVSLHILLQSVSLCTAHNTHAALRHAATSPNLYNDVILPSILTNITLVPGSSVGIATELRAGRSGDRNRTWWKESTLLANDSFGMVGDGGVTL